MEIYERFEEVDKNNQNLDMAYGMRLDDGMKGTFPYGILVVQIGVEMYLEVVNLDVFLTLRSLTGPSTTTVL